MYCSMEISGAMLHPQINPIYLLLVHLALLQGTLGPSAFYCQRNANLLHCSFAFLLMDKPTLCHPTTKL